MGELRSTSMEKRHEHVVWLRDDGSAEVSYTDGHTHLFIKGVGLGPAPDGHTHDITNVLARGEKKDKRADKDKVADVKQLYKVARDFEEEARKIAKSSEDFFRGDQWEKTDEQALKAANRACLTINEIEPKIDLLSGYQRQNRQDIKFLPVEGGDARVAELLNVVVKNITDTSDMEYEETDLFEDVLIAGRGCWHVYIDRDTNIEGDIKIERWPWTDVYFGPFNKRDQSDLEYLCKTRWFSKAKLEQMYPDKAADIVAEVEALIHTGDEGFIHDGQTGDAYSEPSDPSPASITPETDPDFVKIAKKEFRLIELISREYEKVPVAFNADEDAYIAIPDGSVGDAKSLPGFRVAYRNVSRIRRQTVSAGVLLEDEFMDEFGDFNIIPVFAKLRGKHWWGKVHTAKDPQREINKRHSQLVDIMNKCATYGWFYDDRTFGGDQKAFNDWLKNASSPGFNQKVANQDKPPQKEEGVKWPGELVNLELLSTDKLREIMNINPEMLGINSKAESGVAIAEKKRQGLVGNEFLFDNLALSKKRLGRLLVRLIQKIYTPERILRIVQSNNARSPIELGGKSLDQYDPQEIVALLTNSDLTKYDVAVSESAFSPTNRRYNFIVWSELASRGVPVPPELLIELSDLGDKEKVKAQIKSMQEQAQKMEQAKIDAEIQKTLISAQSKAGPSE